MWTFCLCCTVKRFFWNTKQYRENECLHCQTCSVMVVPQYSSSPNWPRRTEVPMFCFLRTAWVSLLLKVSKSPQAQAAAEMLSSVCQVLKFSLPPRRRDKLLNNEREPHHSDSVRHFGLYLRLNKAEQVFELGSCLISEYQSCCWSYTSGKLGSPNFWLRYWLDQAVLRLLAWRE